MINLGSTPSAPVGSRNVAWQSDVSGNVSANLPLGVTTKVTVTPVAGVLTFDTTAANSFLVNLNANVTSSSIIAGYDGEELTILWIQDVTGSRTVVMPTNLKGVTTPSAAANSHSVQKFTYNTGDGNWYAISAGVTGL
jgi:hypothetical protein